MQRRVEILLVACGVLALAAIGWRTFGRAGEAPPTAATGAKTEPPRGTDKNPAENKDVGQDGAGVQLVHGNSGQVEPTRELIASGLRVLGASGAPLADAELSWAQPSPGMGDALTMLSQAVAPRLPEWLRTDSRGQVGWDELERLPGFGPNSALLVSHVGHAAMALVLAPDAPRPSELRLAAGAILDVRVADASGAGVAGAEIVSVGRPHSTTLSAASNGDLGQLLLARGVYSGSDGRAVMPQLGETQWVIALHGARRSAPREVRAPAVLQLTIGESFSAGGRVKLPPGGPEPVVVRVRAVAEDAAGLRALAEALLRPDGTFGPLSVPQLDARDWALRVEGGDLVPEERRLAFPAPGTHVEVQFEPRLGLTIRVRVSDLAGSALAGATVEVWRQEGNEWQVAYGTSDGEGLARVGGCVPGAIWIRALRHGYLSATTPEPRVVVDAGQDPFEVSLAPSGRLRGRVLAKGRPVRDFTVHHWDVQAAAHRSRTFSDREEGEFELADVPRGPLEVRASAPGHAVSEELWIDLASQDPDEVVLELRAEGRVHGQVLHALSGEPVGGAEVTLFLHRDQNLLEAVGSRATSDSDGRFVLSGLAPGENRFTVTASGFTPRNVVVTGRSDEDSHAGAVTLAPLQDLVVHLRGAVEAGYATYLAELSGDEFHAPRPFASDGSLVFVGVGSGRYTLRVHDPAGIWIDHELELRAGARWLVTVELDPRDDEGIEVLVDVEGASPELIAAGVNLHVATQIGGQARERWLRLPASLRTRIPGPLGDEVVVELYASGPRAVGARRVRTADHRQDPVRLRFDERGLGVRVVDADGEPAAGAWVQLRAPDDPATWKRLQPTDYTGQTHFSGLPDPPLYLDVSHATHGISSGHRIDFQPDDRELLIRLDTRARLFLKLHDGPVPLPGVTPALATSEGALLLYLSTTNPEGATTSAPLAAGGYFARIGSPGFWPTLAPIEMGAADTQVTIQVRRLGALALRVVTPEGLAFAGARIELTSQEFGESVARWLGEGRVSASGSQLVTDERGELRLFGLPNGPYRYTLTAPGAEPRIGFLQIPPHAQAQLELQVGD